MMHMWVLTRKELLGKHFPRVLQDTKKNLIFLAQGFSTADKGQFCPQGILGHVWGHLLVTLRVLLAMSMWGLGMLDGPTERDLTLNLSSGEGGRCPVWPSGPKGLICLYYRPKSVSSPQRKIGRLITFPYVLPRIFLGKMIWDHLQTEYSSNLSSVWSLSFTLTCQWGIDPFTYNWGWLLHPRGH